MSFISPTLQLLTDKHRAPSPLAPPLPPTFLFNTLDTMPNCVNCPVILKRALRLLAYSSLGAAGHRRPTGLPRTGQGARPTKENEEVKGEKT